MFFKKKFLELLTYRLKNLKNKKLVEPEETEKSN